jgi:hypothetical protein
METGFVLDQTYGANVQSSWIRGAPERSVWTGVKLKGRDPLPITTHRCPKCWYLEFYAPPT